MKRGDSFDVFHDRILKFCRVIPWYTYHSTVVTGSELCSGYAKHLLGLVIFLQLIIVMCDRIMALFLHLSCLAQITVC